jgi:S-formylglutathione hydrolase FrmB
MTLRETTGAAGAPWERPLNGRLDKLVVVSQILDGNPLGDPARRPLYVYVPPGAEESAEKSYASVYVIQGYTGQVDMWLNRSAFEPSMFERLDEFFSSGDVPPAIVVFVDAWTSSGGSQFINSAGTGRYMDYLCDEIVPFIDERYPTVAAPQHRGITGKSSGGYGAMVVPMVRSDVFGALATHAGDALFEVCYAPEFRQVARVLRDDFESSYDVLQKSVEQAATFDWDKYGVAFETYGYALCYSPDETEPGKPLLPFDIQTGRIADEVWERWLSWDPVRMAPQHGDELAGMKMIYIDAGKSDEYYLDLGAQAFSGELDKLGIEHHFELFDGKHGGLQYRYPRAIGLLAEALTP